MRSVTCGAEPEPPSGVLRLSRARFSRKLDSEPPLRELESDLGGGLDGDGGGGRDWALDAATDLASAAVCDLGGVLRQPADPFWVALKGMLSAGCRKAGAPALEWSRKAARAVA